MTEEEAKEKICCGPLQQEEAMEWVKCKGKKCMAWRSDYESEFDENGELDGYCGLAGKP